MEIRRVRSLLVTYIGLLSRGLETTNKADERPLYTQHLAAAAMIFAAVESSQTNRVAELIGDERRSFGWSFLSGDVGEEAEHAFHALAEAVKPITDDKI